MNRHQRRTQDRKDRSSDPLYEIRATDTPSGKGFAGYASTWWAVDSYYTAMAPGAFTETLKQRGDKIKVLYNHNPDDYVGTPDVLREDDRGLYVEASLFDDGEKGTTLINRLKLGANYGLSFGFRELRGRPATEADPLDMSQTPGRGWAEIWIIEEVKLYEFSPVTFPANEEASITDVRKSAHVDALRQLYDDIRDGGLDDDELALITQITTELEAAAPQRNDAARTDDSRRRASFDLDVALARFGHLVGVTP